MSILQNQLTQLRAETPGCEHVNHLNNAGAALMPDPVIQAITLYIHLEAEIGGYEAASLKTEERYNLYVQLATCFNASPHNFAFVSHSTDAYAKALSSIPFEKGDIILTTNHDYNSNQLAFLSLRQRMGVEVMRAPDQEKGGVDVQALEQLILKHRPRLVAVTHVPTNSGLIQPVAEIGAICTREGILYLVDGCQSVGQLPVDLKQINCDFFTASFRKFLRGPRGAGFLYVSDQVLEQGLTPLFPDLRSAQWMSPDEFSPKPTAHRFEHWEQSYALVMGSRACLAYANTLGIETISERTLALAAYSRSKLLEIPGCNVLDIGEKLAGIATFNLSIKDPVPLQSYLRERHINVSIVYRESALIDFENRNIPWAIRISPHYYNLEEEIDASIEEIKHWVKKN